MSDHGGKRSFFRREYFKRSGRIVVLAAIVLLGAGEAYITSSQQKGREKVVPPLQYEAGVTLKLVQVSVVDKKGDPVKDLTRDDFLVYDNGKPVTLTDFEKHILGAMPAGAKEDQAAVPKPPEPSPHARPYLNRKIFFFFDFAFNTDRGLRKAREAALSFLDNFVVPEDEIGILTYSLVKGLRTQEYLTKDHKKIRKVIEGIEQKDLSGRADEIEERYWTVLVDGGGATKTGMTGESGMALPGDKFGWERQEGRSLAGFYSERLSALAVALRSVPGRKFFLFFSTGIPSSLIYGLQLGLYYDAGDGKLREKYEAMVREFNASGCTIFTFDSRASVKNVNMFARDEWKMGLKSQDDTAMSGIHQREGTTGRNSLERISQVTGGEYFGNIDFHDKSFAKVENQTGSFYVLGYPLAEKEDGKYHEVRVEVRRPGCKVRGSSGYFSPKPFREYNEQEKMLHLFDLALNEGAASRLSDRFLMNTVPVSAVEDKGILLYGMLDAELAAKLSGGPLELVSVVFDSEDNVLDLQVGRTGNPSATPYLLVSYIPAKPGTYRCRLVVRNMATGKAAVSSVWKTVIGQDAPGAGLKVLQPMLFATASHMIFRLTTRPGGKGQSAAAELYPLDDRELVPVLGEVEELSELTAAVPCLVPEGTEGELSASAYLIDSRTGARVPAEFFMKKQEKRGSTRLLTLGLPPSAVKPGTYVLYVNVRIPGTDTAAGSRTMFTVTKGARGLP